MDFHKARHDPLACARGRALHRAHDRVEAFDMPHHQTRVVLFCEVLDLLGFVRVACEWFLDQARESRFEERLSALEVVGRWDRDGDGIHTRFEEFLLGCECFAAMLLRNFLGAFKVRINNTDQFDAFHFRIHTRVVLTHTADADGPASQWGVWCSTHELNSSQCSDSLYLIVIIIALNAADSDQRVHRFNDVFFAGQTNELLRDRAVLEDQHCWDRTDVELHRDFFVVVDVELPDLRFTFVGIRDLVDCRREHLARLAPLGPEIDQHGLLRFEHIFVKVTVIELEGVCTGHGFVPFVVRQMKSVPSQSCAGYPSGVRDMPQVQIVALPAMNYSNKPAIPLPLSPHIRAERRPCPV